MCAYVQYYKILSLISQFTLNKSKYDYYYFKGMKRHMRKGYYFLYYKYKIYSY